MSPWRDFLHELDCWHGAGCMATFWWRDDDAVTATPQLAELMALRDEFDIPIAIAVIPAGADPSLVKAVTGGGGAFVLQHGCAHRDHATDGSKKIELGGNRSESEIAAGLRDGRERLAALFGERLLPVVVPPWNRIDPGIVPLLPALGYEGLSMFAGRRERAAGDDLVTVNTHIDIIDWRGTRAFCGERRALDAAIRHLAARRQGRTDNRAPTGLLTHHLAHDSGCWGFIRRFLAETSAHPAARWISARSAFEAAS